MPLNIKNLQRVGGGIQQVYSYRSTGDDAAAIAASGYFNGAKDQIGAGDIILCTNSTGATVTRTVTSARGASPVTTA
jgi:hypothetical protein